jgi:hypothetical protein
MDSESKIDKGLLLQLLNDLDAECDTTTRLYVVGGAAMVLQGIKEWTKDVDLVNPLTGKLFHRAPGVGSKYHLPEGWLNDALAGFMEIPYEHMTLGWMGNYLQVFQLSPAYLFFMKASVLNSDRHLADLISIIKSQGWDMDCAELCYKTLSDGKPLPSMAYFHIRYALSDNDSSF